MEALRADAECHHAQLAKLMDSEVVNIKDQKAYAGLCGLRAQTSELRTLLGELILYVESHVKRNRQKAEPSEAISGTYEDIDPHKEDHFKKLQLAEPQSTSPCKRPQIAPLRHKS